MTKREFFESVGHWPEQDDLKRANCKVAGGIGHYGCGVCEHGKPVFLCIPCFTSRAQAPPFATSKGST